LIVFANIEPLGIRGQFGGLFLNLARVALKITQLLEREGFERRIDQKPFIRPRPRSFRRAKPECLRRDICGVASKSPLRARLTLSIIPSGSPKRRKFVRNAARLP
jgi:hypothetical protein